MLSRASVTTMLPVVDLTRARTFYQNVLGLRVGEARPNGEAPLLCQGSAVMLYPRATPTTADHTALSFRVDDVATTVRELEARGAVFEDYDLPGLKTVEHVCVLGAEKAAWFKDTEGNILCVHEET